MQGIVITKHIKKTILASFGITIVLVLGLGAFSIIKMMELAKQTENLYRHPFSVANFSHKHMIKAWYLLGIASLTG